jgi:hypothetical protein
MSHKNTGIDYLLELNARHSQAYIEVATERRRYRGEHPTEIAALKCMDGRLHLPVITRTALGIIQPFRNLGGKFDLGWPYFQATLDEWIQQGVSRGRYCAVFVTYHFSRGDAHRGCRGFKYDAEVARMTAVQLKDQFLRVYGQGSVVPLVCGIETDLEALILHGDDERTIDLSGVTDSSPTFVEGLLNLLYPSLPERVVLDLVPLVAGNIEHIAEVRAANRPVAETEHKEWVLGIGRGFDWLYTIDTAFIVGSYDPNLSEAIETGARLLKSNIDERRIDSSIVLMTSAVYQEPGSDYGLAREKALFLSKFALDIIKNKVPNLVPHLQVLTGLTDLNTRKFEVIERRDNAPPIPVKRAKVWLTA